MNSLQNLNKKIDRLMNVLEVIESVNDKPFSVEGAAEYLDCSPRHIRQLMHTGKVKFYKPERRVFIYKSDLDLYAKTNGSFI